MRCEFPVSATSNHCVFHSLFNLSKKPEEHIIWDSRTVENRSFAHRITSVNKHPTFFLFFLAEFHRVSYFVCVVEGVEASIGHFLVTNGIQYCASSA